MKSMILLMFIIGYVSAQSTRARFRAKFNASDFVYNLLGSAPERGDGGTVQPLGVSNLPSLEGEGVSHSLFTIEPCGINSFHSHPRATEILYVIDGDDLQVGFVEENGGRVLLNRISTGDATFFPEGFYFF